jgi:hypothetical protein
MNKSKKKIASQKITNIIYIFTLQNVNLCKKTFSIKNQGISQGSQHSLTDRHLKIEKELERQSTFKVISLDSYYIKR